MARIVVQRVRFAAVEVSERIVGQIGRGLAILVGIGEGDGADDVDRLADKVAVLRVFEDDAGKMNLGTADVGGSMLVVSQFTLYGDVRRGRRPGFSGAAAPEVGRVLVERFAGRLRQHGFAVEQGEFGAHMVVRLENDGPVTLVLDSAAL